MTLTDLDLAFDNTALATNATNSFPSPLSGEGLGVGCGASYLSPNPPLRKRRGARNGATILRPSPRDRLRPTKASANIAST